MKALTRKQQTIRAELVARLRDQSKAVAEAVDEFNDAMGQAWDRLSVQIDKYNDIVGEADEFRDGIACDAQDHFDDRSERWQGGDAGEMYQAWIDEWESELPTIELDRPNDADTPDMSAADDLENLADEP